jgi:hypothetical protein
MNFYANLKSSHSDGTWFHWVQPRFHKMHSFTEHRGLFLRMIRRTLLAALIGALPVVGQEPEVSAMVTPGKLIFETAPGGAPKLPAYAKAPFGEWNVVDGAFIANERKGETHHPSMRVFAEMEDPGITELEVRFGSKPELSVTLYGGAKRMIGLTPEAFWVRIGATDREPAYVWGPVRIGLSREAWHKIRIEVNGDQFLVALNGTYLISGIDPAFSAAKSNFAFGGHGGGTAFRGMKIWRGEASAVWGVNRPKPAKRLSLEEFNFVMADRDGDGTLTEDEYVAAMKDGASVPEIHARFGRLDRNGDERISRKEFGLEK